MRDSAPHIVLATPCFGGLVHQTYMLSVCALLAAARERGIAISLELLGGDALIARARSLLVGRFLDRPDATHLLFVDADIGFSPEAVFRLLDADKAFVAGLYPLKAVQWEALPARVVAGEPLASAGLTYVGTVLDPPEGRREGNFATAAYAGTGFQLIRRTVFERLIAAHPDLKFTGVHQPGGAGGGNQLYALFDSIIDPETGAYLSEDFAFCRRWRALGGEIWLDLKSELTHVGADHFRGQAASRFR